MKRPAPSSRYPEEPRSRPGAGISAFQLAPTLPDLFAARHPSPPLPGDYILHALVHVGRENEVWRATDAHGRRAAIKVGTLGPASAGRFNAEARALAAITHRCVARLIEHGTTLDGRPFLAVEWLEGETVAQLLEDRGHGLSPEDAIRLLMPIASALALAHDRGFVHGDVRADNVLIVFSGDGRAVPKLIDFAQAKKIAPTMPPPSINEPTSKVPQAPDAGDPISDMRAFAETIFHAIAGRAPFVAPLRDAATAIPRTGLSERDLVLWRILAEGLAAPAAPRFRCIYDFARDLAQWAGVRGLDADITGSPILARWR